MVRVPFLIAWVLATLLSLSLSNDASADEHVVSWDFESESDAAAWVVGGETLTSVPDPVERDRAARLAVEGKLLAAHAVYEIALQPGATYRFSGQALVDDPNVYRLLLEIRWEGATTNMVSRPSGSLTGPAPTPTYAATFEYLSTPVVLIPCNVVSPELAVVLTSKESNVEAYVYLDDLRLERVEPPQPCPSPTLPPAPPPTATLSSVDAPSGVASPSSTGSLDNGGFEVAQGGLPVSWRNYGGALTQVAAPVRGGSFAGALSSASASTKWAYQVVAVAPGAWYQMDAYVYLNDPRAEAALLRISWYMSADGSGRAVAAVDSMSQLETRQDRYRFLTTGSVQPPPGVRSARVRVLLRPRSSASAVIYIDDVSFRTTAPSAVTSVGGSAGRRGSGGGGPSEAFGLSNQNDTVPFTPFPTPVLVRASQLAVESDSLAGGGATWWPWAAAGGAIAIAAAGAGAWWWRRRNGMWMSG